MNTNFITSLLPESFEHCYVGQCSKKESCLHYLKGQETKPSNVPFIGYHPNKLNVGANCQEYVENRLIPHYMGFMKGAGQIPAKLVATFNRRCMQDLGMQKTRFYQLRKGEIPLTPYESEQIASLFAEMGVNPEEAFDEVVMRYDI